MRESTRAKRIGRKICSYCDLPCKSKNCKCCKIRKAKKKSKHFLDKEMEREIYEKNFKEEC